MFNLTSKSRAVKNTQCNGRYYLTWCDVVRILQQSFLKKNFYVVVASRQVEITFYRRTDQRRGWRFIELAHVIRRTAILFRLSMMSQLQNGWMLTCWNLLRQKLQNLLVVEKLSGELKECRKKNSGRKTVE